MSKQDQQRAVQPAGPLRPRATGPLVQRRRLATIAWTAAGAWEREGERESCVVTVTLTDGRTISREAVVEYEVGARHRIMEHALAGRMYALRQVLDWKARAIERVRGELQREWSCVPWCDVAEAAA